MTLSGRTRIVGVIVTPAKYNEHGHRILPAQGYTRSQRRKDLKVHAFLSDIKRSKRAKKVKRMAIRPLMGRKVA